MYAAKITRGNPSYLAHILNVFLAYIIGICVGNIIAMPYTGPLAIPFIIGGIVIASPLLLVALLTVVLFKANIERNTRVWCVAATVLVPVAWLVLEYVTNYSNRFDIAGYLSIRNVWERAALALLCAGIGALSYYFRIQKVIRDK